MLRAPESLPDHSLAASWAAGSGTPGIDDAGNEQGYNVWREAIFGAGDPPGSGGLDDPDGDGAVNLVEYAAGTGALDAGSVPAMAVSTVVEDDQDFLAITYTRNVDRPDIVLRVEFSTDLVDWVSGPAITAPVLPPVVHADGTERLTEACLIPIGTGLGQYLRIRIELSP